MPAAAVVEAHFELVADSGLEAHTLGVVVLVVVLLDELVPVPLGRKQLELIGELEQGFEEVCFVVGSCRLVVVVVGFFVCYTVRQQLPECEPYRLSVLNPFLHTWPKIPSITPTVRFSLPPLTRKSYPYPKHET